MTTFKIGVVCEGPTDFYAIKNYLGNCLTKAGKNVSFVDLHPEVDKTRTDGGWARIHHWLGQLSPRDRYDRFVSRGLFAGNMDRKMCDCFLIQADTDIIPELGFQNTVQNTSGLDVAALAASNPPQDVMLQVLENWASMDSAAPGEKKVHVFCPAVESTENWCIAAFKRWPTNPEGYSGQTLTDHFMECLERQEGRDPSPPYSEISKNVSRRKKFCEATGKSSRRLRAQCAQYNKAFKELSALC
ncbi:hypothetical protein PXK58_21275 [Phaeobacter gallaeciensis]|uniref:hypothetical protein n=1 Tax=Phaeobacter gallaeciensis TaxID=60890 RepID=UPI002380B592|nr:hypothetical protein [Phaeobacter gallaeciensis]MDE4276811.1 hypothetical protein [Phaeobacter gallaeciensis]MDE4302052.1 hypothetical protein [Phaeobacter gallaeciensis]MDE5187243.1 hypothetical protein [Phaeobacter gallaeciensis]